MIYLKYLKCKARDHKDSLSVLSFFFSALPLCSWIERERVKSKTMSYKK